ncbi:hypothetical protein IJD44_07590 [bacterium]|nr:hypothetical protein [bacterium]
MRKDIKINVDTQTDGISLSSRRLGISSENLQGKIIFTPKPFIDGICRMYIEGHGTIEMDKQEDCYTLDIKSSLLITPSIDVCFKITEPEKDNGVPIYATKIMHFEVLDTIESNEPIPEQYPQWTEKIDKYVETKETELDTYTTNKKTELDTYKTDLEKEISTTKDTLVNDFNSNAESKTNAFNDNATEKTTNYNTNAETKIKEYNTNATNKVNEFNENVDSLENELTELANQMPWNTTEIQDSIHVEDSAKYSRNKLGLFGNLVQEKTETGNNKFDGILEAGNIGYETGLNEASNIRVRSKNYIDVSGATKITIVAESEYETAISIGLRLYDKDYNYIGRNAVSDFTKSVSFNVSAALIDKTTVAKYCRFNVVDTDITKKFSVNINEILEYEEYIPNKPSIEYPSMPVVATGIQKISRLGKNYLDIPDIEIEQSSGITAKVENNKIILNGTATSNRAIIISSTLGIVLDGTYTFSQKVLSGSASGGAYRIYLKENSSIDLLQSPLTFTSVTTYATNTIDTVVNQLGMYINKGNTFDNYTIQLQVEKGDTATSYEEPIEKETFELDLGTTELCKIVDENNNVVAQDRAVYKDGKWQFEKNIRKILLDGSQAWVKSSYSDDVFLCVYLKNPAANVRPENIVNDKLPIGDYVSVLDKEVIKNDKQFKLRILVSRLKENSVQGLQDYLVSNPITIYSPMIEATYEDCTPAQSEVLDKLYKLNLQQGTNNIIVESENGVTTELQLTYMQDLMSQINELKEAIVALGGNE